MQGLLRNVKQICATRFAFAASLEFGAVVTWGDPACGGDSSEVQGWLMSVRHIQASDYAFAAILAQCSLGASVMVMTPARFRISSPYFKDMRTDQRPKLR